MIPHHIVTGDGPPLVLANSLGANLHMWDGQAEELARHFTLIRFDMRGHGASRRAARTVRHRRPRARRHRPARPPRHRVRARGRHLHRRDDRRCGCAINAPERVDRLVLICTSAKLGPPQKWRDRAPPCVRRARRRAEAVASAVADQPGSPTRPPIAPGAGAAMIAGDTARRATRRAARVIEHMDLLDRAAVDHRADARDRRRAGSGDAARARPRRSPRGIPGARLEILDPAPRTWPTSSAATTSTRLILEHLEA